MEAREALARALLRSEVDVHSEDPQEEAGEEMHEFARRIGMRPEWFQPRPFPHCDLLPRRRLEALRAGAIEVTTREMVRRWREGERQVPDERDMQEEYEWATAAGVVEESDREPESTLRNLRQQIDSLETRLAEIRAEVGVDEDAEAFLIELALADLARRRRAEEAV